MQDFEVWRQQTRLESTNSQTNIMFFKKRQTTTFQHKITIAEVVYETIQYGELILGM